jgi:hypothetical protein
MGGKLCEQEICTVLSHMLWVTQNTLDTWKRKGIRHPQGDPSPCPQWTNFLPIKLLAHLGLLVIEHDKVAIGHVEAGEVVDGGLGVVYVLVYHEGHAKRVLAHPHPNLPYNPVLPKDAVHLLARYVE